MSLNNPQRRPWGTPRGARIVITALWGMVALAALVSAVYWVRMLQGDHGALTPSIVAFNVSIFGGIGASLADTFTASRRGIEDAATIVHLPGAWFTGAGIGALLTPAIGPINATAVFWGAVMFIGGAVIYISPQLLAASRANRARDDARTKSNGAHTTAKVTEVHTFYRDIYPYYRVTMRFTDREGRERWFARTAAAGSGEIRKGQSLRLHFDPARPGRRRSLVVDWPKRWSS